MSKETENSVKAELNKHINTKLFQKFLVKEAAKIPEAVSQVKKDFKTVLRKSPKRDIEHASDNSDQERLKSPPRALNKTLSYKESLRQIGEGSPDHVANRSIMKHPRELSPVYSKTKSPLKISQLYDFDIPDSREKPYIPLYTADPLLLKNYEATQQKLQDDLKNLKEKYEASTRAKNDEIKRFQKLNDNLKKSNFELQSKLETFEENERKLSNLKVERDILDRKIHSLESECDNYRRQLEYAKETSDSYKNTIEEYERNNRNRVQDVERDLRVAKDRSEDLERQLFREKERNQKLERKLNKSKEKGFHLENENNRLEERVKRLERDLQEAKDRLSYENSQQLHEIETLRRKIEDLTQEISRKNDYQEDTRKLFYDRKDFNYNSQQNMYTKDLPDRYEPRREHSDYRRPARKVFDEYSEYIERRSDPISYQKTEKLNPRRQSIENVKGLENKLMNLQMDKKRLDDELSKIPPQSRRIAQLKRKEDIELELQILNSNISTIKTKLRQLNAL
jgi:uncharacterized phage infection (PIP) family protein YhgE